MLPEREILALHRAITSIRSVSGEEAGLASFLGDLLRRNGLPVQRLGNSLLSTIGRGPVLLLDTHLDTVPPVPGWTRDPWDVESIDGKVYGLGSNDAKASVAAMLYAAKDLLDSGGMDAGRLLLLFAFGEETGNSTMEAAVEAAGEIDAAVVGEPTNLDFAIAQRGLLMVDLVAQGEQRHAGNTGNGEFTNAAVVLARDILQLNGLFSSRIHPLLGPASATVTMLEAGVSRNVTPPVARAVLDVRSTPDWDHEELARQLRSNLSSDVIVTSRRLVPCETPAQSRLLETAIRLRPEARQYGSPTCSDWVFFGGRDAFKCGPGTSARSHDADEYVDLPEVTAARSFYAKLARAYLAGR